ncbi:MAG TPA: hypothetical protein VGH95_02870 [Candidatus Aquirickettsiella sp.]
MQTHTHFTVDDRDFQTIDAQDLIPFAQLTPYLDGIMAFTYSLQSG